MLMPTPGLPFLLSLPRSPCNLAQAKESLIMIKHFACITLLILHSSPVGSVSSPFYR